jgi:hypothetical protein
MMMPNDVKDLFAISLNAIANHESHLEAICVSCSI